MPDITVTTYEGTVAAENLGYTVQVVDGSVAHDVPAGGTTGQSLVKASDDDYDLEWSSLAGGGSTVSVDADGTVTVDGSETELATDLQLAAHEADTTSVHGIANTANLETQSGAQTKADLAEANAEATAAAALAAHEADTTSVHGITNTANLETTSGAQTKVDTHAADTTAVHGIADTANLILEGDSRLTNSRTPSGAAGGVLSGTYPNPGFAADMATQAELDAHTSDTTAAHAASAISFSPTGTIAATDVQAAIAEVASEASAGGATDLEGLSDVDLTSPANDDILQQKAGVFVNRTPAQFKTDLALAKGDVGLGSVDNLSLQAHLDDTGDAHDASAISYAGSTNLAATDVESALDELDSEKAAASHTHAAADIASGTIAAARLGSGSGGSTKFLREDSTWQTVSGGGSSGEFAYPIDNPANFGTDLGYDYEFSATSTSLPSGFSWVNQGGATYNEQFGAGVITAPNNSGESIRLIAKSLSGVPSTWELTAKIEDWNDDSPTYSEAGLLLRDSSSGKIIVFGIYQAPRSTMVWQMSSPTASSTFPHLTASSVRWKYLKIKKNSATSYDFSASPDGAMWKTLLAAHNVSSFMTPDQYGIGVNRNGSNAGYVSCQWLRLR